MTTKVVSITSGKGGVGKTTIVGNLAYELAKRGHRILIFDGDLGMANVDILFGVKPLGHLLEVLQDEKSISDIITPVSPRIDLLSGGSGLLAFNQLTSFERRAMIDILSALEYKYDYLLVDTSPGIGDNVLFLNAAANVTAVIINPDPASFADSYALIKVLNQKFKKNRFAIICNQVRDEAEGLQLFKRFSDVSNRFLSIGLDYWGSINQDSMFRKYGQTQRLILKYEPQSEPALQMSRIGSEILRVKDLKKIHDFWEQVVGVA